MFAIGITPADAGKTNARRLSRKTCQDHPRGCGENCPTQRVFSFGLGSPPRMRGKLTIICSGVNSSGITPADAGKTQVILPSSVRKRDHPRGCGENRQDDELREKEIGSPPRMRGKHVAAAQVKPRCRITPADAGKTLSDLWGGIKNLDHPRGCGENRPRRIPSAASCGSPPRMRGKQLVHYLLGNGVKDHPRGCGENKFSDFLITHRSGSPPRMRGKLRGAACCHEIRGITPADAGKTA